jgi:Spy/CpxP family protein refolding chaperone
MRMRIFTLIVACYALLPGSVSAHSSQGNARSQDQKRIQTQDEVRPSPRPSRWWTSERYKQELKLSAEQIGQIDKIFQSSTERMRLQKQELDRAQSDFSQLMKQTTAGERDLQRAADSLELARFTLSKERTGMLVRIHSVLTPDQRVGLDAIMKRDGDRNRSR